MKRNLIATALAAAGLLAAGIAHAADTHTVTVSATVVGTCKFNSATSTVTLTNNGTDIDPSLAVAATGNTDITFRCTKNATSAISIGGVAYTAPLARTLTSGGNTMGYTFTLTGAAQLGTGFGAGGSDLTLNIAGNIPAATVQGAAAGSYSDSVVLSITP
jgi:spore coat protein U-like protein